MTKPKKVVTRRGVGYKFWYTDATGKRTSKTVYCSLKEAEKLMAKIEAKKSLIEAGIAPAPSSRVTLQVVVDRYLENGEKSKAFETIKRERKVFNPLLAVMGNVSLSKITTDMLEDHINQRLANGITPAGAGLELRHIKALFSKQVKTGKLVKNPVSGISPPKQVLKPIRFLTKDEVKTLLKKIDNKDFKDLILGYLNTGARRGETLSPNFTWDHVQFGLDRVKIEGKGDKVRYVPMNAVLREILERRKAAGKSTPFDFSYSWTFKKLAKYYEAAEIDNANVHTLRKTFGSLLLQQGEDIFKVSKLLGHSSVVVTQNHYADILKDDLTNSVSQLESLFDTDDD